MFESYEDYLKRTKHEDTRETWKWWKIESCGMEEAEAIKASVTEYKPLKRRLSEWNKCPCCHYEKVNTEWHFNFKEGIKICDDCYNAMRITERDFFNDEKSSAEDIFKMLDHVEATRYLE